ncbi:hypothetical protein Sta7437_4824 (plasmid) [Stanieria cyanosphaera PCC 7437]|uniref:Uncharacterized protein n=1 Tax=Stanieria cyanosphaera (strain ATCC 29371 / PCC 7437) TaxID=111780 RepID=K9Y0J0_STAC7|nr:hypothetical protein [Stanieria cyanosphaera]AFZ38258.1 hypothetical protein Sta7437_4824 [Stanieria cyanosphaera PCC 7437]
MNTTFKSAKTALLVAMSLGIGMTGTSVWANDSANIQDSYEVNTIEGERNTSVQTSTQQNRDFRNGYTTGNSGSSQTNTQDGLIRGYGNYNRQNNEQRSTTIRSDR